MQISVSKSLNIHFVTEDVLYISVYLSEHEFPNQMAHPYIALNYDEMMFGDSDI